MPTDRTPIHHTRPLKPTLASNRTAKTPITPRLAAPTSTPTSTRTIRTANNVTTPRINTAAANGHEDVTPVKPFLSSNVTPRSSSRKSRVGVGSNNSTPSGTPSGTPVSTRPTSTVDFPHRDAAPGYTGLGVNSSNSAQTANRPRSTAGTNYHGTTHTQRLPLSNAYNNAPSEGGGPKNASSMFFHANDARSHEQLPAPKKSSVFFYANGVQDETQRSQRGHDVPSPPLSSVGRANAESKFFHADSRPESRASPPILTPPPISQSPEPWANPNPLQAAPSLRPPSPSKEYCHLSYRKGASQIIRPNLHSRPSALSVLSGTSTNPSDVPIEQTRRRSSVASSAVRLGHGKSASLSSIDSATSLNKVVSNEQSSIVPSPLQHENRIASNGSVPESIASAPPPTTEALSGLPSPGLHSPTKPNDGKSALEKMNELAANARRERKVLDLEISNSSLLSINRSLEKEVRKQKAELRRFRRMSRAGQFSMDAANTTSMLEGFSAVDVDGLGELPDMSEQEEEPEDEEEEDLYSSESSIDDSTLSADALAERDASHRARDEKRLRLDLSKHRELLADSQKMNQSLKKCLDWTEELIKDAQKALQYQVRVSDVKLGGRVLISEDVPEAEHDGDSKALLSPWTPPHRALDPMEHASLSDSERADRDSGIDIDGMMPIAPELNSNFSPLGSPISQPPGLAFSAPGVDGT